MIEQLVWWASGSLPKSTLYIYEFVLIFRHTGKEDHLKKKPHKNVLLITKKIMVTCFLETARLQKHVTCILNLKLKVFYPNKQQKKMTSCYHCEGHLMNNLRAVKRRKKS